MKAELDGLRGEVIELMKTGRGGRGLTSTEPRGVRRFSPGPHRLPRPVCKHAIALSPLTPVAI